MKDDRLIRFAGYIDDDIICEAMEYKPAAGQNTIFLWKYAAAAIICFCIAGGTLFFIKNSTDPNGGVIVDNKSSGVSDSKAVSEGQIIYGSISDYGNDYEHIDYSKQAEKGKIIITNILENAIKNSVNESDLFAVLICEETNADKKDIYDRFVKPLNVKEDYLENGVVFLTKENICSLECSSEFAIVLTLMPRCEKEIVIDSEYLAAVTQNTLNVTVFLNSNIDEIRDRHREELVGLSPDDEMILWNKILKEETKKLHKDFMEQYGIDYDKMEYVRTFIGVFKGELNVDVISKLLSDPRVEAVYLANDDIVGIDF